MADILIITIFFHIAFGAEITAAFILGSMMLLLWQEREAIVSLFWRDQPSETRMTNSEPVLAQLSGLSQSLSIRAQ
jgi:hypothetical protein